MARRPIRPREIENPERIQYNLLSDYIDGNLDDNQFLYRAAVIAIDQVGGALSNDTEPPNPKNSIKARVITDAYDAHTDDDNLTIFWPLFPFDVMPLKEGEHVYVIFEDPSTKEHGLLLTRIPEPHKVNSLNLTPGAKKYEEDADNDFSEISAQQAIQDTSDDPGTPETSEEFVKEEVIEYVARIGDRVIHGSNNAAIVLSRDRITDPSTGETKAAGTVDIVTGRASSGVDIENDSSRVYVTMNSDCDANFDIQVGDPAGAKAHIVIKSNEIRLVARDGMKIVVENGDLFLEAANIHLGPDTSGEAVVLGDTMNDLLGQVIEAITQITVPTSVGPSGPPINAPQFLALKEQLVTALSRTVKVKK